jgi:crossover junction endodeoxyribonuclease RuvC
MKILGIDPGTARTGYGVISSIGKKIKCIDYGCVETPPEKTDAQRLVMTHKAIRQIIKKEKPNYVVIERLFFFRNMKTVMTVSQSRGVVLMACEQEKATIIEYTPLEIKQSLTGYGRAKKKEVQASVKGHLGLDDIPRPDDAADGLAAAICHHMRKKKP